MQFQMGYTLIWHEFNAHENDDGVLHSSLQSKPASWDWPVGSNPHFRMSHGKWRRFTEMVCAVPGGLFKHIAFLWANDVCQTRIISKSYTQRISVFITFGGINIKILSYVIFCVCNRYEKINWIWKRQFNNVHFSWEERRGDRYPTL